jgi:hypothetical protein
VKVISSMSRCLRMLGVVSLVALILGACGDGTIQPSAQTGSSSPSTTSWLEGLAPPPTSTTVAPTSLVGSWVDETANLTGSPSACGNITLVSASPASDVVIAGVSGRGLWARENGAPKWTSLGHGAGSATITNRASSITYEPGNPSVFWESGIYGPGFYQTDNGGTTFTQLGSLTNSDLVSVDLTAPPGRTLLSGMHERSSLFRSTDGGATWVDLTSKLPPGIGYTAWPLVVSQQVFLLGTTGTAASGVFRTTDGGSTWTRVYQGAVSGPAVATSDGSIYWLLGQGSGIVKSADTGQTWQIVVGLGQISPSAASLVALPNGQLATFGASVIVSADHGKTWQMVGPPLPYVPSGLAYSPSENAFYIWHSDCVTSGSSAITADSIMRWVYHH